MTRGDAYFRMWNLAGEAVARGDRARTDHIMLLAGNIHKTKDEVIRDLKDNADLFHALDRGVTTKLC